MAFRIVVRSLALSVIASCVSLDAYAIRSRTVALDSPYASGDPIDEAGYRFPQVTQSGYVGYLARLIGEGTLGSDDYEARLWSDGSIIRSVLEGDPAASLTDGPTQSPVIADWIGQFFRHSRAKAS